MPNTNAAVLRLAVVLLLTATVATAGPIITSLSPSSGPAAGGTVVTVHGSGFSNNCIICSPPFGVPSVYFGSTRATSVTFIDSSTLQVVTPPHPPSTVSILLSQLDGSEPFLLTNAFTFEGKIDDAFDPVLFPVFLPPVLGAFASEFRTTVRAYNQGQPPNGSSALPIYGVDSFCYLLISPYPGPNDPFLLSGETTIPTDCGKTTGRILYVPKGQGTSLAADIRVNDTSRQASSHGVEIPVVHRSSFSEDQINLLGVPTDPRFRVTLRIYSLARGPVLVNVGIYPKGPMPIDPPGGRQILLTRHDDQDLFEPAYAEVTDLPKFLDPSTTMRIEIATGRGPGGVLIPGTPIWAMVTVTNNETQEITTITPN